MHMKAMPQTRGTNTDTPFGVHIDRSLFLLPLLFPVFYPYHAHIVDAEYVYFFNYTYLL